MGKCWMFEETGEVRCIAFGDYFVENGNLKFWDSGFDSMDKYLVPKHSEYDSNPLDPIITFHKKWQDVLENRPPTDWQGNCYREMVEAIQEFMAIVEGRDADT